jgi:hypothetical protein
MADIDKLISLIFTNEKVQLKFIKNLAEVQDEDTFKTILSNLTKHKKRLNIDDDAVNNFCAKYNDWATDGYYRT